MALFSPCLFFPMQISLCLADCHFSACICSSVFCHRSWLWLSWSFARLKVGQLPFFKWHKFVSLYLAHMSPPWERREEGSCGGMIWYELKLFPNRLHRVWSCVLFVWWVASTSINSRRACIISHQLFLPLIILFFTVKYSANNNNGCIFSMTLWLKVPQPYYLWLVGGGHLIVFPCSVVDTGLLRVQSVSVILHRHSAAGLWPECETEDSERKWLCFLFYTVLTGQEVVNICSWCRSNVVCGLIGEYMGLLGFCFSKALK